MTRDSDYYDLSLVRGAPPKVIWLQTRNCSKQEVANSLILNKSIIIDQLKDLNCIELY